MHWFWSVRDQLALYGDVPPQIQQCCSLREQPKRASNLVTFRALLNRTELTGFESTYVGGLTYANRNLYRSNAHSMWTQPIRFDPD